MRATSTDRVDARRPAALRRAALLASLCALPLFATGCAYVIPYFGNDRTGIERGIVYYVGGAGAFGHVGTLDVPSGLRNGGWDGAIKVYGWQALLGGTLRDQIDKWRNEDQARRLAVDIGSYMQQYPERPVHVIALSAGTGITTWAVESLPEGSRVDTVIFLGSSLSRRYDLTPMLRHVRGELHNFYSVDDPVLRYGVPIAGSVDREFDGPSVGGLFGFAEPGAASDETRQLYREKVRNNPYRNVYARYGYQGGHTGGTSAPFVAKYLAPLLKKSRDAAPANTATQPGPARLSAQ